MPVFGVIVVAYFVVTGLVARHHLEQAKHDVEQLRHALLNSDHVAADRWMTAAQSDARASHRWLAGPAWSVAEHVPWFGRPARIERGLSDVAVQLAVDALPAAIEAGDALTPAHLRRRDGAIRVDVFEAASSPLVKAANATTAATRAIAKLPGGSWLPAANDARNKAASMVGDLYRVLRDAEAATRLAPGMLGATGTRRYLLVVENDAEARGLGGLPGVAAVVSVTNGRMTLGQFENVDAFFAHAPAPEVQVPAEYRQTYAGTDVLTDFRDSNASPDFPVVGQVWVAMWLARTGQRLDGAIAADPTTLSYLLAATGPAKLADGSTVSAANIVALTEQQAYSRFNTLQARQDYFTELAGAVSDQVVGAPHGSAHALIKAMTRAVAEHRLTVYSAHADEEASLRETPLAGGLPRSRAPFFGVVVNNAQGSKLDYYLRRTVAVEGTGCSASGQQLSTVTVDLSNEAPENLPAYVTHRGNGTSHHPLGSERLLVELYATNGAALLGVTGNGRELVVVVGSEAGHPRFETDVTIDRGATMTLVFHVIEPKRPEPVEIWKQPGVWEETATVGGRRCG